MTHTQFCNLTCRVILAAATASIAPGPGIAHDTAPAAPRVDCSKAANKNKPACKSHNGPLSNDEIYNAAYWLAHEGRYKKALTLLDQAKGTNDPTRRVSLRASSATSTARYPIIAKRFPSTRTTRSPVSTWARRSSPRAILQALASSSGKSRSAAARAAWNTRSLPTRSPPLNPSTQAAAADA